MWIMGHRHVCLVFAVPFHFALGQLDLAPSLLTGSRYFA